MRRNEHRPVRRNVRAALRPLLPERGLVASALPASSVGTDRRVSNAAAIASARGAPQWRSLRRVHAPGDCRFEAGLRSPYDAWRRLDRRYVPEWADPGWVWR